MEECHKLLTDQVDDAIIRHNVSKPLPLGGQPGQVTIQADFFFNKDLEYLRYGSKGGRLALSISKMKAACYPIWLQQMVTRSEGIEDECKHTSEGDRRAIRTYMRILSVVRIEVFSLYGYDYMKTIVLRRADLNEYIIAERDFKYMYHLVTLKIFIQTTVQKQLPTGDRELPDSLTQPNLEMGSQQNLSSSTTSTQWHSATIDEHWTTIKEFNVNRINTDLVIPAQPSASHSRTLHSDSLFHFSRRSIHFYHLSHSELDDIEKTITCKKTSILQAEIPGQGEGPLKGDSTDHRQVLMDPKIHIKMDVVVPDSSKDVSIHCPMLTLHILNHGHDDS
ncbi:hypothetical protein Tco_0753124 [Tanacetum coccineum]